MEWCVVSRETLYEINSTCSPETLYRSGSTTECFAICQELSTFYTLFVSHGDSYPQDRIETVYTESSGDVSLTYSESESGGTTVNTESWTYSQSSDSLAGTNSWSWSAPGQQSESGTINFAGTRTYSCEKFAAGDPEYTVTWTSSDGSVTTETIKFVSTDSSKVEIVWSDRSRNLLVWNECKRTIDFSYSENEDGGVTTTTEKWQLNANGVDWIAVTSQWQWTSASSATTYGSNSVSIEKSSGSSSSSGGLSTSAIVGIVACLVVAAGMTGALIMYCANKSKMSSGRPKSVQYSYGSDQQEMPTVRTVAPFEKHQHQQGVPIAVTVVA